MKTQEIKVTSEQYLQKKKKRKKRLRKILFWIKLVMLVSLTATTLVLFGLSPVFNIREIVVKGNQHYKSEDIKEGLGILVGTNGFKSIGSSLSNIFTLRFGESEKLLQDSRPYIRKVTVRYIIPSRVRVTILERRPAGVISVENTRILVDGEGYALEEVTENYRNQPLILGLKIEGFQNGQAVRFKNKASKEGFAGAALMLTAINETEDLTGEKLYKLVDYIDVKDPDNIYLGFDKRFKVNFGHLQDLDHNLNFFRRIYYSTLKNTTDKGIIDMTAKDPVLMEE